MRFHALVLVSGGLLAPVLATSATPAGWFLAGNDPASYQMSRDSSVLHGGTASGSLASIRPSKGFGTMMQSFDPADYLGKRLKLSAWVKANRVRSWAGVWMRVDGPDQKMLAFDNMQNRPIQGTKAWARYEVVLDVGENATNISFGILLAGEGKVWISGVQFQTVDHSVPTTGSTIGSKNRKPENLNFDH